MTKQAMADHMRVVTLLIKCCPDVLVDDVVSAVELFGVSRSLLAGSLNISIDQALQSTMTELSYVGGDRQLLHSTKVIYMKTNGDPASANMLKSFVQDELNTMHKTAMYCLEVKPRNFQMHFTLLLTHTRGAPPKKELEDVFAAFGKCSIHTKNHKMTYINFPLFEQVLSVLKTLQGAKLFLQEMVVLLDELVPVQNAKIMVSLDAVLNARHSEIIRSTCITKHNLCTWFNSAKENEGCDKTWEQLVSFVSGRISKHFGWTYDAKREMFRDRKVWHKNRAEWQCGVTELQEDVTEMPNKTISLCSDIDTDKDSCPQGGYGGAVGEGCDVAKDSSSSATAVYGDGCISVSPEDKYCPAVFPEAASWGATSQEQAMLSGGRCAGIGGESQELEGGLDASVVDDGEYRVMDKTNRIPLYRGESHPLHQKLCVFEEQLFGLCETSDTCVYYRLANMEMMMNIDSSTLPLSMRLSELDCWIQQYLYVMTTVPTAVGRS